MVAEAGLPVFPGDTQLPTARDITLTTRQRGRNHGGLVGSALHSRTRNTDHNWQRRREKFLQHVLETRGICVSRPRSARTGEA